MGLPQWALYHLNELGDSAAQAIAVGERLIDDAERLLGPEHPDTLASRNNLALAYPAAGRPPRRSSCTSRPWPTGSGCWARTTPYPGLAGQPRRRLPGGRLAAEALPLHGQTLAADGCWAPTTPTTLKSRNNLANAYREAGRAAEAIPLHEQALADRERLLGRTTRHPGLTQQPRSRLPGGGPGRTTPVMAFFAGQITLACRLSAASCVFAGG